MTITLKFCIVFPRGHNFPCEETEADIGEGQTATVVLKMDVRASCARLNLRKRSKSGNRHGT